MKKQKEKKEYIDISKYVRVKISKEVKNAINTARRKGENDDDVIIRKLKEIKQFKDLSVEEKRYFRGDLHTCIETYCGSFELFNNLFDDYNNIKVKKCREDYQKLMKSLMKLWEGFEDD